MNIIEIILIAIGLSMDTLSLSLAISLTNSFQRHFLLSIIVGIYHFVMPLIGYSLGLRLHFIIHFNYAHLLGIILLLIALSLILEKHDKPIIKDSIIGLNIFALTVSIDAFSVGIGINNLKLLYLIIFAIISFIFTYSGLRFGKYLAQKINKFANYLGIIILLLLGLYNLFK